MYGKWGSGVVTLALISKSHNLNAPIQRIIWKLTLVSHIRFSGNSELCCMEMYICLNCLFYFIFFKFLAHYLQCHNMLLNEHSGFSFFEHCRMLNLRFEFLSCSNTPSLSKDTRHHRLHLSILASISYVDSCEVSQIKISRSWT